MSQGNPSFHNSVFSTNPFYPHQWEWIRRNRAQCYHQKLPRLTLSTGGTGARIVNASSIGHSNSAESAKKTKSNRKWVFIQPELKASVVLNSTWHLTSVDCTSHLATIYIPGSPQTCDGFMWTQRTLPIWDTALSGETTICWSLQY